MPVFVRASRRAKAYTRSNAVQVTRGFLRKAKIVGAAPATSPQAWRLQLQRYTAQLKLPGSVKQKRLIARKRLGSKQIFNGTYKGW